MKKKLAIVVLAGLYVASFAISWYLMPVWQLILPTLFTLGILRLLYPSSKIGAIVLGVIMMMGVFLQGVGEALVVRNSQDTFVIYNRCFLFCQPIIYKKYPYLPLLSYHSELMGETAVQDYRVVSDTIYLQCGAIEWRLID